MDEKVYLISSAEEGSICIVTLMLTGRATPNLHNGIVNIGDEQHYVSVDFTRGDRRLRYIETRIELSPP